MLISKSLFALTSSLSLLFTASAYIPAQQVPLKIAEYDTQGFSVLTSDKVEGYSVRIKQPKSCEEGVQVCSLGKTIRAKMTGCLLIYD